MENLTNIAEQVTRRYEGVLKRRRARYQLAKDLGLPAQYAGTIAGWSEKKIRAVAKDYHSQHSPEPAAIA